MAFALAGATLRLPLYHRHSLLSSLSNSFLKQSHLRLSSSSPPSLVPPPPSSPSLHHHRFLCFSTSVTSNTSLSHRVFDLEDLEEEAEGGDEEFEGRTTEAEAAIVKVRERGGDKLNLSIKEKKELASYAHSLGKKLKSQQVGKSGVTESVATALVETLEANELLKLKIHGNCPGELTDVITQLEESTGSVAVFQIGRTVILYRPSLSKMQKKRVQSSRQGLKEPISANSKMKKERLWKNREVDYNKAADRLQY